MKLPTSVGRRLFLLVSCQTAIAVLLVLVAVGNLSKVSDDYRYMYTFQFQSVAAIGEAMEEAATLQPGSKSAELAAFYKRYRAEFETAAGSTPDAIRFRKDLLNSGEPDLFRQESEVLDDFRRSLHTGNIERLRQNLSSLYGINVRYAALANEFVMNRIRHGRIRLVTLGMTGIALTLFLGLHVQRAIAPRIQVLLNHVRHFQDFGTQERIRDTGTDDIAVLANALDAGFHSIASRQQEREQFLAIAAHELKTPVTSIQGYASLLLSDPSSVPDVRRALEVINRQSWRLSRLIEALFLAMQARSGELRFVPKPFDMSALVGRVLREMEPFLLKIAFSPKIEENISILGDEALLEHALWSLLTCSCAFSVEGAPIKVNFSAVQHRANLTIDIKGRSISIPEIQELFMPFRSVEYETGRGIRSAIGLYLCREIVRIHNGRLVVHQASEAQPEFLMELPL